MLTIFRNPLNVFFGLIVIAWSILSFALDNYPEKIKSVLSDLPYVDSAVDLAFANFGWAITLLFIAALLVILFGIPIWYIFRKKHQGALMDQKDQNPIPFIRVDVGPNAGKATINISNSKSSGAPLIGIDHPNPELNIANHEMTYPDNNKPKKIILSIPSPCGRGLG